MTYIAIIRELI